jgi:hypothetical protein
MPELEKSARHVISLTESVWGALKASAERRGVEASELMQKVLIDFLLKEDTLAADAREDILSHRWLIERVVETAKALCRTGSFAPSLISDAIAKCEVDPEWALRYTKYVRDDMFKHGNPRKEINREFGWYIRRAVGGQVVKKGDGKPSVKPVNGHVFQSYTELGSFDTALVL